MAPHLMPPSKNGTYPTMLVNNLYESISVDPKARRLPPVPKVPLRTKDIRKVYIKLIDDYATLSMPNLPADRQPRRQSYFLEKDDLPLSDYVIEFRNHGMSPSKQHYNYHLTLSDPAAISGIQHQSGI